jgi:hypothetical protein
VAPAAADPAVRAERMEVEGRLQRALADALGTCTVGERSALLLTHREGWSGRDVARLLGVGPPRVSRLLAQATAKVRGALVPALKAVGGVAADADTWTALRDAVGRCLSGVAIPPPAPRPTHGSGADREPADG